MLFTRIVNLPGVLIGYELHRIAAGEETALQQILKDGIVCCRIVNCIIPTKIPKVWCCVDNTEIDTFKLS